MKKQSPLQVQVHSLGHVRVRDSDFLKFDHEQRKGENFSGLKLKGFSAHDSKFESCLFEKMRIDGGSFGSGREISEYIDCSFDGSRISRIAGGCARFEHCSFRDVDLREWFCFAVEMVDCTFTGRMRKVVFNGKPLDDDMRIDHSKRNEFHGNDFSGMRFEDVAFRTGIDLSRQKLPTGAEYVYLRDAETALRSARAEVLEWKDMELRRQAVIWIDSLQEEVREGQRQMLLRAEDYVKSMRPITDSVINLLKQFV